MPNKHHRPICRCLAWAAILSALVLASVQPWPQFARAEDPAAAPPAKNADKPVPFDRPRQWLEQFNVHASYFDQILDGRDVDDSESEALLRMLYAVRRFPLLQMHRLQSHGASWLKWTEHPQDHRGDIMHVDGKLIRVTLEQPVPEVIERFMLDHYFRCDLLVGEDNVPATIFALDLPNVWQCRTSALLSAQGALSPIFPPDWIIDQQFAERASIEGFFFKRGGEPPDPRPVFVTKRVAWHPHTPLGDLGMDVGLLDQARMRAALTSEDRECFYQMLAAVGRADNQELNRLTDRRYSVVPLFNQPDAHKGELIALEGTARRALKVQVGEGDSDVIERFGLDGYYEIELFTIDSQQNPIIFCVRELPHGMPTGEDIAVDLRIAGFLMKTYKFQSHRKLDAQGNKLPAGTSQLAPLLVGRKALLLPPPQGADPRVAWIAGGAFVVVVLGIWFVSWQFNREGKKLQKTTLARLKNEEAPSFKDLGGH